MTNKQVKNIQKTFAEIQLLDKQIIALDRCAIQVVNDDTRVSINIEVDNITKKKDNESKLEFDEDGSIINGQSGGYDAFPPMIHVYPSNQNNDSNKDNISQLIDPTTAIEVLGLMIRRKREQREVLIKKLKKIGVRL